MAVEINQNRATLFSFRSTDNPTTDFDTAGQEHQQKTSRKALHVEVVGGEMEISFDGGNSADILVKPADGLVKFEGLEFSTLSFRRKGVTGITSFRILAW